MHAAEKYDVTLQGLTTTSPTISEKNPHKRCGWPSIEYNFTNEMKSFIAFSIFVTLINGAAIPSVALDTEEMGLAREVVLNPQQIENIFGGNSKRNQNDVELDNLSELEGESKKDVIMNPKDITNILSGKNRRGKLLLSREVDEFDALSSLQEREDLLTPYQNVELWMGEPIKREDALTPEEIDALWMGEPIEEVYTPEQIDALSNGNTMKREAEDFSELKGLLGVALANSIV